VSRETVEYASGGFFICLRAARPEWNDSELVPSLFLSASTCYCPRIPDAWAVEWANFSHEERMAEVAEAGIAESAVPDIMDWTTRALDRGDFGWPNVFYELVTARLFAKEHLPTTEGLALLEIALPEGLVDEFLANATPASPMEGRGGHLCSIARRRAPGPGTEVGFDVLGFDHNQFDSWLCHNMEREVFEKFQICANARGLLGRFHHAERIAEFYREDPGTEPLLWLPWIVIEHGF